MTHTPTTPDAGHTPADAQPPLDPTHFLPTAHAYGWHTRAGSEGKCWLIAVWFAWYAVEHCSIEPHRVAVRMAHNTHARRPADETVCYVTLDQWAYDWASQGHAHGRPWPDVRPEAEHVTHYGGPRNPRLCPACGDSNHYGTSCPGHQHPHRLRDLQLHATLANPHTPHPLKARQARVVWCMFEPQLTMADIHAGRVTLPPHLR